MRWEDERYVRFYTRNTPEWLTLSWGARGLFGLVMREVDRAGILKLGKLGLKGIAVSVQAPWVEIEGLVKELLDDGCLRHDEETQCVYIPNFIEAQECPQSDKARKRASRERAVALIGGTVSASEKARAVTKQDVMTSQTVTDGHGDASSPDKMAESVTPYCAVPSRTEPTPPEAPPAPASTARAVGATGDQVAGSGIPVGENSKVFHLERSLVRLEQSGWIAAYERTVDRVRGGDPYAFPKHKLRSLVTVIEKHCRGEDRQNIEAWVERDVADFCRAVGSLNQDPDRFWASYGPDGLERWHNAQRPGYSPPRPAIVRAPAPKQPAEPPMDPMSYAAEAAKLEAALRTVGSGGTAGGR